MTNVWAEERLAGVDRGPVRFPSTLVSCSPAFFQGVTEDHIAVMQAMYAAALKSAEGRVAREEAWAAAAARN